MSLNIDNKVYRNIQEQVAYNSTNIKKIADYIDGLDVQDSVIVLESLSPLNSEQMKVAEQPLAFIVYDEAIYLKTKEDATYFYFERMMKMELNTVVTLSSAFIQVTKSNGATGLTVSSVDVYSKSQIDTSLGLKANVTYVDTELAKKANLSGATFTGAIKAPDITELMSNYSFTPRSTLAANGVTLNYVSIVKTGNKLTFVIAGEITPNENTEANPALGTFTLPESIGDKLYPDGTGALDNKQVSLMYATNNGVSKYFRSIKSGNLGQQIYVQMFAIGNLTQGTTYYFRYEVTFLLSDNMVPSGE